MPATKIVVVGSPCAGKTTYVRSLAGIYHLYPGGPYEPTLGVEVYPVDITLSSYNTQRVNIWDCAGQENLGGLRDGYYIGAEGAVVYLDGSQTIDHQKKYMSKCINELQRVSNEISIVCIVGKVQTKNEDTILEDVFTLNYPPAEKIEVLQKPIRALLGKIQDNINN